MSYPCTACGACCLLVGKIIERNIAIPRKQRTKAQQLFAQFPHKYDKLSGRCSKLGDDNKCTIYDRRPLVCKVDEGYKRLLEPHGVDKQRYYLQTAQQCNKFIALLGLDESYKIDEEQYKPKKEKYGTGSNNRGGFLTDRGDSIRDNKEKDRQGADAAGGRDQGSGG